MGSTPTSPIIFVVDSIRCHGLCPWIDAVLARGHATGKWRPEGSSLDSSPMIQAHIFFSGMVQGVGFRYTTQRMAADFNLQGWVRNLSDGRVEVLAEGPPEHIKKFIEQLANHFGAYIKDRTVDYQSAQGNLTDFQVRD